jgi:uncharacterized protein YkwD
MSRRAYRVLGAAVLMAAGLATAQAETWVPIQGKVRLADGTPICAMVLANGQYTFSCDGAGDYSLTVPLDASGEVTLFAFADGFAPFRTTIPPAALPVAARSLPVYMETASSGSPLISMTRDVGCSGTPNWVRITGNIESYGSEPLCAMVLANGQYMFSCDPSLGQYDLTVPVDQNGNITLFGSADGFQPYSETFRAPACDERYEMLGLVNNARRQGKLCGDEGYFPPTEALNWSDLLAQAALRHSTDMATHDFFSHTGSDGSLVSHRVSDTGYRWRTVGENIAAGYTTPAAAMQALLDSPRHCANIMNPSFEEFGAARADNPDSYYGVYWTQVFGTSW